MARILVLDGDSDVRLLLTVTLRPHEILEARTVAEARTVLGSERVDAIVAERYLLDGDGLDVVGELREAGDMRPAVVVTTETTVFDRLETYVRGADLHVGKPFDVDRLRSAVQWLLDAPEDERERRRATRTHNARTDVPPRRGRRLD